MNRIISQTYMTVMYYIIDIDGRTLYAKETLDSVGKFLELEVLDDNDNIIHSDSTDYAKVVSIIDNQAQQDYEMDCAANDNLDF